MSQSSFEINTARDLFDKLCRDYVKLQAETDSRDEAINFAVTAHHLFTDWLKHDPGTDYGALKALVQQDLQVETGIIRDVCDGSKHLHLTRRPHEQVASSGLKTGGFSRGFSRGFKVGGLAVTLHDGSTVYFHTVAEKVYNFWERYFDKKNRSYLLLHLHETLGCHQSR